MFTGEVTNFLWFLGSQYNIWFISNGLGDTTSGGFLAKTQTKAGFQFLSLLCTDWLLTCERHLVGVDLKPS